MRFGAIVVAHANPEGLRHMLGNLIYQSRPPDDIVVLASGLTTNDYSEIRIDFNDRARMLMRPDPGDKGHAKRIEGIRLTDADAIGFFNDDDSYDIVYVDRMMWEIEHGADIVFCEFTTIWSNESNSFEAGYFVVRRKLALRAGYDKAMILRKRDEHGELPVVAKVPDVLYHHNQGPHRAR